MIRIEDILPGLMLSSWPTSILETIVIIGGGLTLLLLTAFIYIRLYRSWIIDDFLFSRAANGVFQSVQPVQVNGVYCPARMLERQAIAIPDKVSLAFEDQKYTFAETNSRGNQIANALQRLGINRQQRVALLMKNKPEYIFILFACLKIAVELSLLNVHLRAKALLHCIKQTATKFLIIDNDLDMLNAVEEISEELKSDGVVVLVFGETYGFQNLKELTNKCQTEPPDSRERDGLVDSDVALYLFTSGTTGLPKAARLTYYKLNSSASYYHFGNMRSGDVIYTPLPLYHSATLFQHGAALVKGLTYAFSPKFSASRFWQDCRKHNATTVQYIGETCRYLLAQPPSPLDREHKVRIAIGNGLRRDIWDDFQTRFNIAQIKEFYAATDGNCFFINMTNKVGACGRRGPWKMNQDPNTSKVLFLEFNIEEDKLYRQESGLCRIVPLGSPGLMVAQITARSRFDGYFDKKKDSGKIIKNVLEVGDSYVNTGDYMLWDHDYYLYFVDRIGDTFRWKGENVSTQEVGNLISEMEMVEDCSVYGVPVPGMDGKCGMGAIVLNSGIQITEELLRTIYHRCEQSLPPFARPIFLRFLAELHITATYKHLKNQLQQEGYDCRTVPNLYVQDNKSGTYVPLKPDVYDSFVNGNIML